MSIGKTIHEYLDMVKNGVKNGDKIIEAIRTSAKIKEGLSEVSEEAIAEIMRRKDICAICPFNSRNAKKERGYSSSLPFEHCTQCQCRIGYDDSKEYCLSCQCGLSEWNRRNPELEPMKLKWVAFEETIKKD